MAVHTLTTDTCQTLSCERAWRAKGLHAGINFNSQKCSPSPPIGPSKNVEKRKQACGKQSESRVVTNQRRKKALSVFSFVTFWMG